MKPKRLAITACTVFIGVLLCAFALEHLSGFVLASTQKKNVIIAFTAFSAALRAADYDSAYAMMTPDYQARNSAQDFAKYFSIFVNNGLLDASRPGVLLRGSEAEVCPKSADGWGIVWHGPSFVLESSSNTWRPTGRVNANVDD